jgi:DNA-binding transcriptional ArsR family regulator
MEKAIFTKYAIENMKTFSFQQIGEFFEVIGPPIRRIQLLPAVGTNKICVCHLESLFGLCQAYISQQLMGLCEKGIIASRRDGKLFA